MFNVAIIKIPGIYYCFYNKNHRIKDQINNINKINLKYKNRKMKIIQKEVKYLIKLIEDKGG